jgi:hypothetical protein
LVDGTRAYGKITMHINEVALNSVVVLVTDIITDYNIPNILLSNRSR